MGDNSPVHDGVQSPFWAEDQTSPDQLQNAEKCKQEIKFNKTDEWSIFLATWYRYRFVFLPGNSQLISDSVFPSLVLLLVERIRWGTETGDWSQQRERHTNTDTQGQTAVCVVDHWTNIMPLLFPIRKNKVSQTDSGDTQAQKRHDAKKNKIKFLTWYSDTSDTDNYVLSNDCFWCSHDKDMTPSIFIKVNDDAFIIRWGITIELSLITWLSYVFLFRDS